MCPDHKNHPEPICVKEDAIRNLGGMTWLYDKHMAKFKITYADSPDKIRDYLLNGEPDKARILMHSIKGLAGTLGLIQLYSAATALEYAIITDDPSIYISLADYDSCIQELLTYPVKD